MRNLGKNLTTSLFSGAALLVLLTPATSMADSVAATANVLVETPVSVSVTSDLLIISPVITQATSNLLFSPVAPTGTVEVVTLEAAAEETTESGEAEETKINYSANIGSGETLGNLLGTPASIAVYGEANQTYFITLPQSTTFSNGVTIFNISGFNHNAGVTPIINPNGTGLFNIGASVSRQEAQESQIFQESPETQDSGVSPLPDVETPALDVFNSGYEGPALQLPAEGIAEETLSIVLDYLNYRGPVILGTPFFFVFVSYN